MIVSFMLFHLSELCGIAAIVCLRLSAEAETKDVQFGYKLNKERF